MIGVSVRKRLCSVDTSLHKTIVHAWLHTSKFCLTSFLANLTCSFQRVDQLDEKLEGHILNKESRREEILHILLYTRVYKPCQMKA